MRSASAKPEELSQIAFRNRAAPQDSDTPGIAHIDNRGCHFARAGAAIYYHADAFAKLFAHAFRRGALTGSADVGGSRGDRHARSADDFYRNSRSWHTQRDVAGVGRDLDRKSVV